MPWDPVRGPSTGRAMAASARSATFPSPRRACARHSSPAGSAPLARPRGQGVPGHLPAGSPPATPNTSPAYPEDRAAVSRIARHLRGTEEYLPDGERLTVERFQMVGSFLGGNTRVDTLHHLLEDAFVDTPGGERLSDAFLEQVRGIVSRAANPLYALMHESIYGQGGATDWAAQRVLPGLPGVQPGRRRATADRRDGLPLVLRTGRSAPPAAERCPAPGREARLEAPVRPGTAGVAIACPWPPRCTARTSTLTGICPWKRPRPCAGSRSGKPRTSTMTGSQTTAKASSARLLGMVRSVRH